MVSDRSWVLINGYRLELNKPPQQFDQMDIKINLDANKIEKTLGRQKQLVFGN